MIFSSLTFLFLFLPTVFLVYFAVPYSWKNAILFFFSLLFYAWGEPVYFVLMLFSTAVDYFCGIFIEDNGGTYKAKIGLIISIITNLCLLGFFKYADFFIGTINTVFGTAIPLLNLPLPIGISFYTFQTMSYSIDIYRATNFNKITENEINTPPPQIKAQRNFISFGAYVAMFPQLIAGPIVRYETISAQLEAKRRFSYDNFGEGIKRFVVGLGKKVLIANNIGLLWSTISENIECVTTVSAWMGIIAFTFQIYFDFSGYSDMAIGLGRIFGFKYLENFNYPYISKSITEFWRRWHISLCQWFKSYVYIPLGGNKKGTAILIRNIMIVWLLTGFWHGASWNYVLWGAFYGFILIVEKFFLLDKLEKVPSFFSHLYAFLLINLGFVVFVFENLNDSFNYFKLMLGGAEFCDEYTIWLLYNYLPLFLFCAIASTPVCKNLYEKINDKLGSYMMTWVDSIGIVCVFIVSVAYIVSGSYNPFLYFRF